ncbi:MAG TPA: 3-phosphoshikimate 1-carboxyvinyltransferase [Armatimonadota bacterium]|nr:3-phosphoshikimate 1-carboxyvinyltransferase [Armatimonadota bacterium]
MASLRIPTAGPLQGAARVPGDKSISHRAVMLGALAEGVTEIEGFLPGADCLSTIACFRALGIQIEQPDPTRVIVHGAGEAGLQEPEDLLYVGNSGTTLYLTLGVLAGQAFTSVLTGDSSIRRRPVQRVGIPLRQMGATILARRDGTLPPVTIRGGALQPITYTLPSASAQVKSAVLLAGLFAEGVTTAISPAVSRDHTERMLRGFGADVRVEGMRASVRGPARLRAQPVSVPGDISSAAFLLVAGCIVPGSEILVESVGINPTRSGIVDALQAMGARITVEREREVAGEPVADLRVCASELRGTSLAGAIIPRLIDEIPILAVAAACATGDTVIRDAGALRIKETDRIATTAALLRAYGVAVEVLEDGMVVHGAGDPRALKGAEIDSEGDHRIAMAGAVAALVAMGESVIRGAECVDVSFPGFAERLRQLGAAVGEGE